MSNVWFATFSWHIFHMSVLTTLAGHNDMIKARNKTLTIWLLHKVYCRLLSPFVCLLWPVEDDDEVKIQLHSKRINISATKCLPELLAQVTRTTFFCFADLLLHIFLLLFLAHTLSNVTSLHFICFSYWKCISKHASTKLYNKVLSYS